MTRKLTLVVAVAWVMSLITVGLWAQGGVIQTQAPPVQVDQIITSPDIAFQRVANPGEKAGTVTGRWLVRINGQWLTTVAPVGPVQVTR